MSHTSFYFTFANKCIKFAHDILILVRISKNLWIFFENKHEIETKNDGKFDIFE